MGADALLAELRPHVSDERVLAAVHAVPRQRYVAPGRREEAWDNVALPIACGQTISQPLVVARMCELLGLRGDEIVLDVGTGSGYHAAVLARLARHVYSIEVVPELSEAAGRALAADGVPNVTLVVGDGTAGLPAHAPYGAINVAAASGGGVPEALVEQLADGGRLVAPVGDGEQRLVRLVRDGGAIHSEALDSVRFVPLIRARA